MANMTKSQKDSLLSEYSPGIIREIKKQALIKTKKPILADNLACIGSFAIVTTLLN